MSFALDNSVTMRWFFGDGKRQELAYAGRVLDAMKQDDAIVPVTWGLEVANVIARSEAKALVTEARSRAFIEMPKRGPDIFSFILKGQSGHADDVAAFELANKIHRYCPIAAS